MLRRAWNVTQFCCFVGMAATLAGGQTPTLSLVATELNGTEIPGGSSSSLVVKPGDIVWVKIQLRDWSPRGEALRGYQIQLDPTSFSSGTAGHVEPNRYRELMSAGAINPANAFVQQDDPDFIFFGLHPLAMVETRSAGYRWMGALTTGGIVSPQDGTRFTCGELYLRVTDDAQGIFKVRAFGEPGATQLRDEAKELILPLVSEPLTLAVGDGAVVLAIKASNPPNGSVDARRRQVLAGPSVPASRIELAFNGDAGQLGASVFWVQDGSDTPPGIRSLKTDGSTVTIVLNRAITPGAWTTVTHKPSGSSTRIGALPGDVNNDRVSDARDIFALVDALNGVVQLAAFQTDINRDGVTSAADVLLVLELLMSRTMNGGVTPWALPKP